jgi:PAS domain S-box-containing protein
MLEYSPKHQWHQIIETMNEGILIVNNDDKIMYANAAFCKLSEYDFDEINGKIAHEFLILDAETQKIIKNNIELRKLDISSQYEVQLLTKSGNIIWILVSGTSYKDQDGKTIGSIGLHTNINQIKVANKNLESTNNELELYVYKASHDLRSPLASMLGLIYVWKSETKNQQTIKYLNMLEDTGRKLDYTLTELVKAMKIKGIREFNDTIDFEILVKDVLSKFAHYPGFDRLNIKTRVEIKNDFISNKFIIETILQNLIENVIKYQKFTITDPFININLIEQEGKFKIIISDNGIGIEESIQPRVFDMYFRGTLDAKGSGLGLYLVKKSIEKLDGDIILQSKEGEGTIFTMIIG